MGRELNMDTQRQNFWKESIHKEATVRLLWHMKYSKEFARSSFRPVQDRTKTLKMKPGLLSSSLQGSAEQMAPKFSKTSPSKTITISTTDDAGTLSLRQSEMRPVTPDTRKLLYKGFSAVGEGRYEYLQKRKEKKPEEKYEFPITSGWEYGWKMKNTMKNSTTRPAEFGRTRIVKDSFYRTNGVMPINNDLLTGAV
eukprot:gene5921-6607_t